MTAHPDTDTVSVVIYRENSPRQVPMRETAEILRSAAQITLDGTKSTDSDGSITSYSWTQTQGDSVALTDAGVGKVSFTAPPTDSTQTLGFLLTVEDDDGASDTDTVSVFIYRENSPPNADAGDGGDFAVGSSVTLDGTKSTDSDGSITSYSWTQTEGDDSVTLTDAGVGKVSFTAPSTGSTQTFGFRLTVEDDDGASDTDTVSIVVSPAPESVEIINPAVSPRASNPAVSPRASNPAVSPRASNPAVSPRTSNPAVPTRTSNPAVPTRTSNPPSQASSGGCCDCVREHRESPKKFYIRLAFATADVVSESFTKTSSQELTWFDQKILHASTNAPCLNTLGSSRL